MRHSVPNATYVHRHSLPNGGSAPRVCDFDDLVLRLVKWHPSSHGLTSSYSELVASRLGQLIDAPVIRGTVVYVDPELLPLGQLAGRDQPFHVGFTYLPGQNFQEDDYLSIGNSSALPAAAVQLAWLQIGDQEGHNQFLARLEQVLPDKTTRKLNQFIIVDQASMCASHNWSTLELNSPQASYRLPRHLGRRLSMPAVEPVIADVQALDSDTIRACFEDFPPEWGITREMVDKVASFVLRRRQHLSDILRADLEENI
jgi:hypothetical protein